MNISELGQVFTPDNIVQRMLSLSKYQGLALEPSAGNGAFTNQLVDFVGIELDPKICPRGCVCMDFFDYPVENKFYTIIGNPPYVGYKAIRQETKSKLSKDFDKRSNLYLFFIDKCLDHLLPSGEIIFITPRDFLKATSAIKLNQKIYDLGTITHLFDLGDAPTFKGYAPNCVIWRFEKDDFSRTTFVDGTQKKFNIINGQLFFSNKTYDVCFDDLFEVKVGAVSGADPIFAIRSEGSIEFVYSKTKYTNQTRPMICVDSPTKYLILHKEKLLDRKIRRFNESNWWKWGRKHYKTDRPRIYVNCKTRYTNPFFLHPCNDYDGSVLAIFPKFKCDLEEIVYKLNFVNWHELGFVCDGRYIFSQRSLEKMYLPEEFKCYL